VKRKIVVKLTANVERNLDSIETFLTEAEAPQAYDALLDGLAETVISNLEQFPDIGRLFMQRPVKSVEVGTGLKALQKKLKGGSLHEYLFSDYLMLYARYDDVIYLLSTKHHRQLSFDLNSIWGAKGD
jgi:plasmid stabilization system protein ParE